jgi:cardiolipin synthase A/B
LAVLRFVRILAVGTALALAACAMPPVDRYMLQAAAATPVQLEGTRGPLSHEQSRKVLEDLKRRAPDSGILERHVTVEESISEGKLNVGNKVTLLEDGRQTYPAMLAAIRRAKHHIHMEMYIFEGDEVGAKFAEAMIERRKAGVQVRLMYDSFGSKNTPREFFESLKAAGIELLEFRPVTPGGFLKKGAEINNRNHRKLLLVDGRIAFLGGINISEVYSQGSVPGIGSGSGPSGARQGGSGAGKEKERGSSDDPPIQDRPWRDTQIQVEGPVVGDFQKLFLETWNREAKADVKGPEYFPKIEAVGPHVVRAVEGTPDQKVNPLYVTLISAIESAEKEILLTMAYFVPDNQLIEALKAAARRGVDVQLILPSRSDSWMVRHAGRSFYTDLLEAGVKIHERKERILHSKSAVIDGVWSTVGSTNLDWRSLLHNYELNAVVLGAEFAERMRALFARDLAQSEAITPEKWRRRGIEDRAKEAASRIWAFFL